jgi:DNA ligase (NAD+)
LITTREQYTSAIAEAKQAAAAYYTSGESSLDDPSYDALVQDIAACERAHPDWVNIASPTGKIAAGVVTGDVQHTVPMLSLDNVFTAKAIALAIPVITPEEFAERVSALVGGAESLA